MAPGPAAGAEIEPGEVWVERAYLTDSEVLDLAADPSVATVTPTMPTSLGALPALSTSDAPSAWGIGAIRADSSPFDGSSIAVAVLGTGIDAEHAAFAGVQLVQRDFTATGGGDGHGHGTHVAGILFGRDLDGVRIGVARGVTRALIGKTFSESGVGRSDWMQEAILWAYQEGARVIALAMTLDLERAVAEFVAEGLPPHAATLRALECYRANARALDALITLVRARSASEPGAIVVVAAGDDSRRDARPPAVAFRIAAGPPAAAADALVVGAVEQRTAGLITAPFSNLYPRLCAPGVDVASAQRGGGIAARNGTSMAAAHVAGVAALWWQHLGERSPAELVAAHVLRSCRTGVFASAPHPAEAGAGLVTAPGEELLAPRARTPASAIPDCRHR